MKPTIWRLAVALLVISAGNAVAGTILYTVADDVNGVPRVVEAISPGAHTESPLLTLGDGSLDFAGGLAYDSAVHTFFTLSWDGFNPSSLAQFQVTGAGATAPILSVGYGFLDGLVEIDPTDFYASASAFDGSSALYRLSTAGGGSVTSIMPLGTNFNGGLAAGNAGLLYAIANDNQDNSTLYSINPVTQTLGPGFAIGQGFTGGLTWDAGTQSFYAIASDSQANSTLYQIVLGASATATPLFALGQGYLNAALVDVSPAVAPEPSSLLMGAFGSCAVLFAIWRKKSESDRKC